MCNCVARLTASETQITRFGDPEGVSLVKTFGFGVSGGDPQQSCRSGGALGRELTLRVPARDVNSGPRGPPVLQLCCVTSEEVTKTVGFDQIDLYEVTKSSDLGLTSSETCNSVAHMFLRNMMVFT